MNTEPIPMCTDAGSCLQQEFSYYEQPAIRSTFISPQKETLKKFGYNEYRL